MTNMPIVAWVLSDTSGVRLAFSTGENSDKATTKATNASNKPTMLQYLWTLNQIGPYIEGVKCRDARCSKS